MDQINMKDFDKNNWDEFVHVRALRPIVDQLNQASSDMSNAQSNVQNAMDTANQAKNTANNLQSEIDSAKQEAQQAMTTANQANQTAEGAQTVAAAAQDTATTLGGQVAKLDGQVIKKSDTERTALDCTLTSSNVSGLTAELQGWFIPFKSNTGDYPFWDGHIDFDTTVDLTNGLENGITFTPSITLPSLSDDQKIQGTFTITDGTNQWTGICNLQTGSTITLYLEDFLNTLVAAKTWLKTGTKHFYMIFNDIN